MASVYCKSCNAKITAADSTCPSCGAPTSRVIPFILCLALLTAGFLLYSSYHQGASVGENSGNTANSPPVEEERQSRVGFISE